MIVTVIMGREVREKTRKKKFCRDLQDKSQDDERARRAECDLLFFFAILSRTRAKERSSAEYWNPGTYEKRKKESSNNAVHAGRTCGMFDTQKVTLKLRTEICSLRYLDLFIITTDSDRIQKVRQTMLLFLPWKERKSPCKIGCTRIFKHIMHKLLCPSDVPT